MEAEKRNRIIDWSLFAVMLLAVSAVTLWLFYKQTTGSPELYHSDMKAYILEMQGLDSGYSFPFQICRIDSFICIAGNGGSHCDYVF